ncbi:hypothetical protein FN846DRAFT_893755 [Sphaerosporella brunnea]|uniref:Uncharacterized protein n=1 Tax=Sphaerosporella brunnea TaxID=1250544 RepID=A0A5J5EKY8_9PEZI|nr:hypothetical protein FN846DRAFT_893755 [Sphaerosporella brunnea]
MAFHVNPPNQQLPMPAFPGAVSVVRAEPHVSPTTPIRAKALSGCALYATEFGAATNGASAASGSTSPKWPLSTVGVGGGCRAGNASGTILTPSICSDPAHSRNNRGGSVDMPREQSVPRSRWRFFGPNWQRIAPLFAVRVQAGAAVYAPRPGTAQDYLDAVEGIRVPDGRFSNAATPAAGKFFQRRGLIVVLIQMNGVIACASVHFRFPFSLADSRWRWRWVEREVVPDAKTSGRGWRVRLLISCSACRTGGGVCLRLTRRLFGRPHRQI